MQELNVALVVEAVAAAVPEREAIVWRDRRATYADVVDRARRLARWLQGAGVAPGELVLLYLTNCPEYLEGMVGGYLARVGPANVNYRYTDAEVEYIAVDSGARAAIVHRRFAAHLAGRVEHLLVVDDGSDAALPTGAVDYEAAVASAGDGELPRPEPDDLYVVYTGGTTGRPKGVLWRQADFLAGALGVRGTYGSLAAAAASAPPERLRALAAPPLMHGAAHWNAISCLAAGGTVVLQDHPERFDPDDVLDVVERERCTSLNIVGDAFGIPLADAIAAAPHRDLSTLRHLVTGGAVLSDRTKERLAALVPGLRVIDIVGSSESGRQGLARGTGTGRFERDGEATILADDRSRRLAPDDDSVGWLATTGPIPLGYHNDPQKTAETFPVVDGQRFVVAGDRARWGPGGSIELLGRESATINTGGEKVFAEEVEAVLRTHPAVADAAVGGRPHERFGQEVVAVVALRPGHGDVADDALREHCAASLARYKLPRAFVRVDHVQRTAAGKTDHAWTRGVVTG